MPPPALISSTARSIAFFQIRPYSALSPVIGPPTPSQMSPPPPPPTLASWPQPATARVSTTNSTSNRCICAFPDRLSEEILFHQGGPVNRFAAARQERPPARRRSA